MPITQQQLDTLLASIGIGDTHGQPNFPALNTLLQALATAVLDHEDRIDNLEGPS